MRLSYVNVDPSWSSEIASLQHPAVSASPLNPIPACNNEGGAATCLRSGLFILHGRFSE